MPRGIVSQPIITRLTSPKTRVTEGSFRMFEGVARYDSGEVATLKMAQVRRCPITAEPVIARATRRRDAWGEAATKMAQLAVAEMNAATPAATWRRMPFASGWTAVTMPAAAIPTRAQALPTQVDSANALDMLLVSWCRYRTEAVASSAIRCGAVIRWIGMERQAPCAVGPQLEAPQVSPVTHPASGAVHQQFILKHVTC